MQSVDEISQSPSYSIRSRFEKLKSISRMRKTVTSLLVLLIFVISTVIAVSETLDLADQTQAAARTSSSNSTISPIASNTYGTGLSGGPVILDANYLASLEGNPRSIRNMELNVTKYFVPLGINLVFLDIFWGSNGANTSTSQVAGGYDQAIADWLTVGVLYNIKTIFFFKQFGYFFSSPSWDQEFLNAYPQAATDNSNGVNVPLGSCGSGCDSASAWTIASPFVYRQLEEDLKQLYSWYGSYTSWIGFGEGGTGDKNYYIDPGLWNSYYCEAL